MTRRRHLAALFAPAAALLLAACAAQNAPVAPASPAAADASAMKDAPRKEVAEGDLEAPLAALGAAEDQIGRAIHRWPAGLKGESNDKKAEEQERARGPSSLATASPSVPAPKVGQASGGSFRAGDDGVGDACTTACSALGSMQRAAKHLCDLTGDGDERCDSAKSRVSGATERVTASCPACSPSN
ncbi:MAG: hypothetical protein ABJE95_20475 [Byssovorax sp.]